MISKIMTNPNNFAKEARKCNIYLIYLQEAILCIGKQNTSRMFNGKSVRGGTNVISSATIDKWVNTLQYAKDNTDKIDNDRYQSYIVSPRKEWDEYIELIKTPIDSDIYNRWDKLSKTQLGDVAVKYGITIGIRNNRAIRVLYPRMMEMIKRRKKYIWNKNINISVEEKINYNSTNVPNLKKICKKRNIVTSKLNKKQIIAKLIEYDTNPPPPITLKKYDRLIVRVLKKMCKERGIKNYNKKLKSELVSMLEKNDYEEDDSKEHIETENTNILLKQITNKNNIQFNVEIRKSDGYVNATALCKAGGKKIAKYLENIQTKEFLKELGINEGIRILDLIDIKVGGNHSGSWVHRKIAYHMSQWISAKFAVQVTNILDELFITGEVKLERPIKVLQNLDNMDIEAEILEQKIDLTVNTNRCVLYLAYVGDGMVKIGYSDCKLLNRIDKHTSSTETNYKQFRLIKIFQISGRNIEKIVHRLLTVYREVFHREKEVYKPPENLEKFVNMVNQILDDNDLKLQLDMAREELNKLRLEVVELKLENMTIKNGVKV